MNKSRVAIESNNEEMVVLEWHDAKFFPQICDKEAIRDYQMASFRSLGYLVFRDKITTVIAAECNDQDEYRDVTLIPSGSVISIHKLATSSLV